MAGVEDSLSLKMSSAALNKMTRDDLIKLLKKSLTSSKRTIFTNDNHFHLLCLCTTISRPQITTAGLQKELQQIKAQGPQNQAANKGGTGGTSALATQLQKSQTEAKQSAQDFKKVMNKVSTFHSVFTLNSARVWVVLR